MLPSVLLPENFEAALKLSVEKEIREPGPARSNWPSRAGHPCTRFLVWVRTRWAELQKHDAGLQSVFNEGHFQQKQIIHRLEKMGFEIVEQDRPFEFAGYSGRLDGKIKSYLNERFTPPVPLEAKSCSPYTFDALNAEEDIIKSKHHYIRGYQHQLNLYMIMDDTDRGVYLFKNKVTGWLKLIPSKLDWALADSLVKRSKEIDEMVVAQIDPPPIGYDDGICGRCGFLSNCYPPRDFGEGAELITDQTFLDTLARHQELKPLNAEYNSLDKFISKRVKGRSLILAGEYVIEGKEGTRQGYTVPDSVTWTKTIRRVGSTPIATED